MPDNVLPVCGGLCLGSVIILVFIWPRIAFGHGLPFLIRLQQWNRELRQKVDGANANRHRRPGRNSDTLEKIPGRYKK